MAEHYSCQTGFITHAGYQLFYRRYQNLHHPKGRKMLMLHGAGVDGALTWEPTLHRLHSWGELLVPDLRGMGESHPVSGIEQSFLIDEVVADVRALLDHLAWFEMDLAGYSFGGLVAMLLKQQRPSAFLNTYLLEPAFMERLDQSEMVQVRQSYSDAAKMMREVEPCTLGITQFLDLISPRRSKSARVEQATVHRLQKRVLGLSYALDAVTEAVRRLERAPILAAQSDVHSFVGHKSLLSMQQCHQAQTLLRPDWRYHEVVGADHSLPFQKPSRVADVMEQSLL